MGERTVYTDREGQLQQTESTCGTPLLRKQAADHIDNLKKFSTLQPNCADSAVNSPINQENVTAGHVIANSGSFKLRMTKTIVTDKKCNKHQGSFCPKKFNLKPTNSIN